MAHHLIDASHAFEIVLNKVTETNSVIKVLLPALDTAIYTDRDVTLLADGAAEAAGLVTSSNVGKGIAEIVELGSCKELWRHVVLEPKNLRDLHFDTHFASDVSEQVVVSVIDELGLIDGTVVQPQNDVPVVSIVLEVGAGDGDWLVGIVRENS